MNTIEPLSISTLHTPIGWLQQSVVPHPVPQHPYRGPQLHPRPAAPIREVHTAAAYSCSGHVAAVPGQCFLLV